MARCLPGLTEYLNWSGGMAFVRLNWHNSMDIVRNIFAWQNELVNTAKAVTPAFMSLRTRLFTDGNVCGTEQSTDRR